MNPQIESFQQLTLPLPLAEALKRTGFHTPTPVQAAAVPEALLGKDILATAQTGTGKTAAFGIPLLSNLALGGKRLALILAPTRELAAQINKVLRTMSSGLGFRGAVVVGGESFNRQADALYDGVDYIVATPGRLNDHLREGTADLSQVDILVLDEVDRMLDMGFAPQIKQILSRLPKERQTLLFSATLPPEIATMASTLLRDPVRIAIGPVSVPIAQVKESFITTTSEGKNAILLQELKSREGRVLVFTRTKSRADRLAKLLDREGHKVVALHGGKSQGHRKRVLESFGKGSRRIMVATDLAGRGIDVPDIEHIINYDVPMTREDYIHRIGRTGRAGKTGSALSLLLYGDAEQERIAKGTPPPARPQQKKAAGRPPAPGRNPHGQKRRHRPWRSKFSGRS